MAETGAEFNARMRSLQVIKGGRTKPKERIITRPNDKGVDVGKRAKQVKDETGSVVTTSDNRQDVNIVPQTVYQEIGLMQG